MERLPSDKRLHALAGAVAAAFGFFFCRLINQYDLAIAGCMLSLVVAYAKEAWDGYTGKGTVDPMDFVATIAGGGIITWLIICIHIVSTKVHLP